MMVARYLERCGDNVCKMAEKIHYAVTGERLLLHRAPRSRDHSAASELSSAPFCEVLGDGSDQRVGT